MTNQTDPNLEHDKQMAHIAKVRATCKELNCSVTQLLEMDYIKILGYEDKIKKSNEQTHQ